MDSKERMLICGECNEYREYEIKDEEETYCVKGENIKINAKVTYCKCCHNQIWNEELDEENLQKAYNIYRQKHGLVMPKEIKQIREKYGVSQTTFAKILGFGEKTITRYENGSIAEKAQSNLILLMKNKDNFKALLEQNKEALTPDEYNKILNRLNSTVQYSMGIPPYFYEDNKIVLNTRGVLVNA